MVLLYTTPFQLPQVQLHIHITVTEIFMITECIKRLPVPLGGSAVQQSIFELLQNTFAL